MNGWRKDEFALCLRRGLWLLPLDINTLQTETAGSLGPQAFRLGLELEHLLSWTPSLAMAEASQLPLSRVPALHDTYLSIFMSV